MAQEFSKDAVANEVQKANVTLDMYEILKCYPKSINQYQINLIP